MAPNGRRNPRSGQLLSTEWSGNRFRQADRSTDLRRPPRLGRPPHTLTATRADRTPRKPQARPYTGMAAPLVGLDSSLARKRITWAISAGGTQRE